MSLEKIEEQSKELFDQLMIINKMDKLWFKELDELLNFPEKIIPIIDSKLTDFILVKKFFNKEEILDIMKHMSTYERSKEEYKQLKDYLETEEVKQSIRNLKDKLILPKNKLYETIYASMDKKHEIFIKSYENLKFFKKAIAALNNEIELNVDEINNFYDLEVLSITLVNNNNDVYPKIQINQLISTYLEKKDFQDKKTLYRVFGDNTEDKLIDLLIDLEVSEENLIIKNDLINLLKASMNGFKSRLSKENYEYQIYKLPLEENVREMFLSYSKCWRTNKALGNNIILFFLSFC